MSEVEAFAAERKERIERSSENLIPLLQVALGTRKWDDLIEAASRVWQDVFGDETERGREALGVFRDVLREALEATKPTADGSEERANQVTRMALWMATFVNNDATYASLDEQGIGKEWVTMKDDAVRATHRAVEGEVASAGGTFNVGGVEMRYPGEPVGNPDLWLGCRCVLRPAEAVTAAAGTEVEDLTEEELAEGMQEMAFEPVPWHGILCPIEKVTGDRRMFAEGSLTWRDLPLPLTWQKVAQPGHDGAVVVANIEEVWIEDGLVYASGFFVDSPEADEVISLRAQNALRGVSVDIDDAEVEFVDDDGNAVDIFELEADAPQPIQRMIKGRICSATIVPIPAFQEAFFDLGTWPEAMESDAECEDCEPKMSLIAAAEDGVWILYTEYQAEDARPTPEESYCLVDGCKERATATVVMAEHGVYEYAVAICENHREDKEALDAVSKAMFDSVAASAEFAPGTKDGPGWITNPAATSRIRRYWVSGKGAAKIRWGAPGDFNRCRRQLAKYVQNPEWLAGLCANMHKEALGIWPGEHHATEDAIAASGGEAPLWNLVEPVEDALVASAARKPREWFSNPDLEGPTPLTITEDGRVFGHVATWGVCHIGSGPNSDRCVMAPRSVTNYAYFHVGAVATDAGEVPVGHITMGTGHAPLSLGASATLSHYDNTGSVVADIACGEDAYGIWFSGALRPGLPEEKVEALRAAALSGDWRRIGSGLEMVAALAVNVPGFPIPRTALAASGAKDNALVAAAVVPHGQSEEVVLTAFIKEVIHEYKQSEERAKRAAALADQFRERAIAAVGDLRTAFAKEDTNGM